VEGVCDECGASEFKRRPDDNEVALRNRLLEYYKKTSPLIGYYHAKDRLVSVDGLAQIDAVAAAVARILDRPV
jgi:adenylate kinase